MILFGGARRYDSLAFLLVLRFRESRAAYTNATAEAHHLERGRGRRDTSVVLIYGAIRCVRAFEDEKAKRKDAEVGQLKFANSFGQHEKKCCLLGCLPS